MRVLFFEDLVGTEKGRRHYHCGSTLCWGSMEIGVTISDAHIPHAGHVTFVSHLALISVLKEMHFFYLPIL